MPHARDATQKELKGEKAGADPPRLEREPEGCNSERIESLYFYAFHGCEVACFDATQKELKCGRRFPPT